MSKVTIQVEGSVSIEVKVKGRVVVKVTVMVTLGVGLGIIGTVTTILTGYYIALGLHQVLCHTISNLHHGHITLMRACAPVTHLFRFV